MFVILALLNNANKLTYLKERECIVWTTHHFLALAREYNLKTEVG